MEKERPQRLKDMSKAMWLSETGLEPTPSAAFVSQAEFRPSYHQCDMGGLPSSAASMEHLPDLFKIEGSDLFSAEREKHPSESLSR